MKSLYPLGEALDRGDEHLMCHAVYAKTNREGWHNSQAHLQSQGGQPEERLTKSVRLPRSFSSILLMAAKNTSPWPA
jgi:hypothetical protein